PPPTTTTRRPCSFKNVGNRGLSISIGSWLLAPSFWLFVQRLDTVNWLLATVPKNQKPGGFGLPGFGYVLLRSMLWFRTSTRVPKAGKPQELHTAAATITRAGIPGEHFASYIVQ